jgi:hypothetical protein
MSAIDDCPPELRDAIREFWSSDQWDNAANISRLESGWSAFAEADTRTPEAGCSQPIGQRDGQVITAEHSIGWYQVNACNLPPGWRWEHLFNTRHNVGTAHMLWDQAGQSWRPWFFSARELGLL